MWWKLKHVEVNPTERVWVYTGVWETLKILIRLISGPYGPPSALPNSILTLPLSLSSWLCVCVCSCSVGVWPVSCKNYPETDLWEYLGAIWGIWVLNTRRKVALLISSLHLIQFLQVAFVSNVIWNLSPSWKKVSPRHRILGSGCGAGQLRRCCWWRVSLPACRRCTERHARVSVIWICPICDYWQYLERKNGRVCKLSSHAIFDEPPD